MVPVITPPGILALRCTLDTAALVSGGSIQRRGGQRGPRPAPRRCRRLYWSESVSESVSVSVSLALAAVVRRRAS